MDSAIQRLIARERAFAKVFPKRLVGELQLSEVEFRELLGDLRELPGVKRPPKILPRVGMVAMVFTARYDYKGAFWRAFQGNLAEDDLEQSEWGQFFRSNLRQLGMFSPPEHWMVNVFPVLYHAIIPEASKDDFGIMVRSLTDAVDIRDLDDKELLEAIGSYDLPLSLRLFVGSKDSASVACDLVRRVAEDFRQLPESDYDEIDTSTIDGALLSSVCHISPEARRRFRLHTRLLVWRLDFGTGELGVVLTGNLSFDDLPLRLCLGGAIYEIDCFNDEDGKWIVTPRIINVPICLASSTGVIEFASGTSEPVRVARIALLPLFFRSAGNYGTFVNPYYVESGIYAIVSSEAIDVRRSGEVVSALELLPSPNVPGAKDAALYELIEGDQVHTGDKVITIRGRMRPSATIAKASSWLLVGPVREAIPVYDLAPRICFESPMPESSYQIKDVDSNRIAVQNRFNSRITLRPDATAGTLYRATILTEGHASGADAVEFIILPLTLHGASGAEALTVSGEGRLSLGDHEIPLSDDGTEIRADLLLRDNVIDYEFAGRHYRLQYVGPRPLAWRLGEGRFSRSKVICDTSDVANGAAVEFRGTPGTELQLVSSDGTTLKDLIGRDGGIRVALSRLLSGGPTDRLAIMLETADGTLPCIDVVAAPIAYYNDVGLRKERQRDEMLIAGQIALDKAVDRLVLEARPYKQPWLRAERAEADGFARNWEVRLDSKPGTYSLELIAEMAGRDVPILDDKGVWSRIVGQQYDARDDTDYALYEALRVQPRGHVGSNGPWHLPYNGTLQHDDRGERAIATLTTCGARGETIRRCIALLMSKTERTKYDRAIADILFAVGASMSVTDLSVIDESVPQAAGPEDKLVRTLAMDGLPIASTAPRLWASVEQPVTFCPLSDLIESGFLEFCNRVAGDVNQAQASGFIDTVADDVSGDALQRAYARLLRVTLATSVPGDVEALASSLESPEAHRARKDAIALLEWTGLPLDAVLGRPYGGSLFSRTVNTTWLFSLVARSVCVLQPHTPIPRGVQQLSAWLYNSALRSLVQAALARAEVYCQHFVKETPLTC